MSKVDSIKAKIRNLAIKEGRPFDYLLIYYFIERLLYRLSVSRYADNFILKGGLLLYTVLDNDARFTKDIDFLARRINNSPDEIVAIFSEIAAIPLDDAVRYDAQSITVERIKEDADYQGVRVKLAGYLDKSRHVLQFDIGFGDVIVPQPSEMEYPSLLNMDRAKLKAYSLESVIAEKFEAMIYLAEANSRMKDFYDIYTICRKFEFEGRVLFEAVSQTLEHRATPLNRVPTVFSSEFPEIKDKQTQWKAFRRRIKVATGLEFPEVVNLIKTFLEPIYTCVLEEKEFYGIWNCETGEWCIKAEQIR